MALGVGALLLSLGVGVHLYRGPAAPAEWHGGIPADSLDEQRERAGAEAARERIRRKPLAADERIDPNRATADELDRLPRVGPALAERIVAHREARGPFRSLADLDAVSGVGPAMLDAITPHVALPPAPRATPAPALAAVSAVGPAPHTAAGEPVDLNAAAPAELQTLPGIGPALAGRIVEWRSRNGRFARVEDLAQVSGIGSKTLERLRPLVRVSP